MTSSSNNSVSPCVVESATWRDCMKHGDYMPDRDLRKCNDQRRLYFDCINAWRAKQPPLPSGVRAPGAVPPTCSGLSDKLRTCMEIHMFETMRCQREMGLLRSCVAAYDPEVAQVTAELATEDAFLAKQRDLDLGAVPELTSAQAGYHAQLWKEKPKWGKTSDE